MNLDGWEIDVESLPGPDREKVLYVSDALFQSPDGSRAALVYSIDELSMGAYHGSLAVFSDRDLPWLEFNPLSFLCFPTSVTWLSNDLFAVGTHLVLPENRYNVPFVLVDLSRKLYSFIPFVDGQSYSLVGEEAGIRIVEQQHYVRRTIRVGVLCPWKALKWFSLFDFDDLERRYKKSFTT